MLQKTKSMLTKLLMLLCVVCCAVALAFGLAGCSGVTVDRMEINADGDLIVYYSDGSSANLGSVVGEPAEQGKTVADVTYDDATGVVTIHYSDGTTDTFTVNDGTDDSCDHEDVTTIPLVTDKWDCSVGGTMLEVCNDCGATMVVNVPAGHHYVETTVAPTCVNEGYTTMKCEYCDEEDHSVERTNITPATGEHVYATEGYEVAYPGGTICAGGWMVYPCEYHCGNVKFTDIEETGHTVTDWNITQQPTGTTAGSAKGYCTVCGDEVPVTLPALTTANLNKVYKYTITEDPADINCSMAMDAEFTYVDEETGTTVTFKGTLPVGSHTLNDKLVEIPADGTPIPVSELPEGMEIAGNSNGGEPTCADEGAYAVFTCEVCHRYIVVSVVVPHTKPSNAAAVTVTDDDITTHGSGDIAAAAEYYVGQIETYNGSHETTSNTVYNYAATEDHVGFSVYYCSVCKEVVTDDIAKLEHRFTFTEAEPASDGSSVTITATCENCTDEATVILTKYTTSVITEVSCENDGLVAYTGTVSTDTTGDYTVGQVVTINVVVEQTNHVHPVYGDVFEDDPAVPYDVSKYPDMELAGNSGEDCADPRPVYGVFVCEDCGQRIVIPMQWAHTEPTAANNTNVVDLSNPDLSTDYEGKYDSILVTTEPGSTVQGNAEAFLQAILDGDNAEDNADYDTVFTIPATCGVGGDGWRTYICTKCGKVHTDVVPHLEHRVAYSFEHMLINEEGDANDPDNWKTNEDDEYLYVFKSYCANECTSYEGTTIDNLVLVDKDKVEDNAKGVAYIDSVVNPSCTTEGTTVYVVIDNEGKSHVFREQNLPATHMLNGKLMYEVDEEGNTVYYDPADHEGLEVAGNSDLACGGNGGTGVFICDICHKPIVISVKENHTAPTVNGTVPEGVTIPETLAEPNENFVANRYYKTEATCEDPGAIGYFCTVCKEWVYEEIPATGHDFRVTKTVWDEDSLSFKLTLTCANTGCDTSEEQGAQPATVTATLNPFVAEGGNGYKLEDGYTVNSFVAPTHSTYGNFNFSYTLTADDIDEQVGTDYKVDEDLEIDVTLTGRLSRGDAPHFHIVNTEYTYEDPTGPSKYYYWYVSEYDEKTGDEISRTYYVGEICDECGEMWATYQLNATNGHLDAKGTVTGDNIPESTNPNYAQALLEDAAAEEDAA